LVIVEITGIEAAIANLENLGDRVQDIRGMSRDILLAAQTDVDARFDSAPRVESGGAVTGGINWPALSPQYLEDNPRRKGGQILRDFGTLQQSYGIGQAGNISTVSSTEIVFGSALPKARYLATKRPQVFLHAGLIQVVTNIVEAYAMRSIK
jgi:hypothetical protein